MSGCFDALACVVVIGDVAPFRCGKQIASYIGLVPAEDSISERRRLGHISKRARAFPGSLRILLFLPNFCVR